MTIADQLIQKGRQEGLEKGREEGREEGKLIGEILLAQRILKLTIYSQEELEGKSLDDLKSILTKMEAQLQMLQC